MTRSTGHFALSLITALLALSALVPLAQAAEFHAESYPQSFEVEGKEPAFTIDNQAVTCTKSAGKGELTQTASTLTILDTGFSECTAFGFAGATVNPGSCYFVWHLASGETANADIVCPGEPLRIKASAVGSECEVSIGAQNARQHVVFTNLTIEGVMYLHATVTLSGVQASKNKDNFLCPLSGTGTINSATFRTTYLIPKVTVF